MREGERERESGGKEERNSRDPVAERSLRDRVVASLDLTKSNYPVRINRSPFTKRHKDYGRGARFNDPDQLCPFDFARDFSVVQCLRRVFPLSAVLSLSLVLIFRISCPNPRRLSGSFRR